MTTTTDSNRTAPGAAFDEQDIAREHVNQIVDQLSDAIETLRQAAYDAGYADGTEAAAPEVTK